MDNHNYFRGGYYYLVSSMTRTPPPSPDELRDIGPFETGTIFRDWHDEGIRILVMRGPFHPCVYLGIPLDHPLSNKSYDDLSIRCHGGLTYAGEGDGEYRPKGYFWYGYDYGHCDDYTFYDEPKIKAFSKRLGKMWSLKEIVADTWEPLYDLKKLMKLAEEISNHGSLSRLRSLEAQNRRMRESMLAIIQAGDALWNVDQTEELSKAWRDVKLLALAEEGKGD